MTNLFAGVRLSDSRSTISAYMSSCLYCAVTSGTSYSFKNIFMYRYFYLNIFYCGYFFLNFKLKVLLPHYLVLQLSDLMCKLYPSLLEIFNCYLCRNTLFYRFLHLSDHVNLFQDTQHHNLILSDQTLITKVLML